MRADEIKDIFTSLRVNDYSKILITGEWGIGKSYYVWEVMNEAKNNKNEIYCYMSLLGAESIKQVMEDVLENILRSVSIKFGNFSKRFSGSFGLNAFGFGLTLPSMESNIAEIIDRIGAKSQKKRVYIIFDNIERIGHRLSINEVLGMIEKISNIKNVKVIIMTWEDMLLKNEKHREAYQMFKDRSIEKVFNINEEGKDALLNICGQERAGIAKRFRERNGFVELQTLKKGIFLFNDVMHGIRVSKVIEGELLEYCLSVVAEKEEEIYRKRLALDDKVDFETIVETYYIRPYVRMNRSYELIKILANNYEGKGLDRNRLKEILEYMKDNKQKKPTIFLSEKHVECRLLEIEIEILNETNLSEIVRNIDEYEKWINIIKKEEKLDDELIKNRIKAIVANNINVEIPIELNKLNDISYSLLGNKAKKFYDFCQKEIEEQYILALLKEIEKQMILLEYGNNLYIKKLKKLTNEVNKSSTLVRENFRKLNFIFPMPREEIDEDMWIWCNDAFKINCSLGETHRKQFINYIDESIEKTDSTMLQYRLNILKDKYCKV